MKLGLLNTPIVTEAGIYNLKDITLEEATEIIMNRQFFSQKVGQECLVFKLNGRPEEDKILNSHDLKAIGYKFQLLTRKA